MSLVYSAFVPHPPIVVPEIGRGQEEICGSTLEAYREVAARVAQAKPETVILVSPHAPLLEEGISVLVNGEVRGSFADFGVPDLSLAFPNDGRLVESLSRGLPRVLRRQGELDHGALVPLYFLERAGWRGKVVLLSMPWREPERYGAEIGRILRAGTEKTALVASGDLSHRLREEGPYGFDPTGPQFDQAIVSGLKGNPAQIGQIPAETVEQAGECGYRSLRLALAAQEGMREVLSYEGPFGVGYLVAELYHSSPLPRWARLCLTEYVKGGDPTALPEPEEAEFQQRRGCFVTLKKDGELRGCIGTTQPYRQNLASEILYNALAAGTEDPRFWPVKKEEVAELTFSVDVLGELEKVTGLGQLDPWHYGIVVSRGGRTGLLLPHLEGVDTVEDQLRIAKQKAGISPESPVEMWRFEVVRHFE
ncbi:AmmeMemoRadiSam system protein A [Acididesulfobacillus acetoxydans]|uniref:AmmeMemoRadiSam system protein A n=1 Tax=Acididesulfobacillus acetoxydans TaxID=1561005 RepID=UPI001F0E17DE|nr:AmmeMemoRadiSam system protein A [Acididesulfobacillus acetoxydans]